VPYNLVDSLPVSGYGGGTLPAQQQRSDFRMAPNYVLRQNIADESSDMPLSYCPSWSIQQPSAPLTQYALLSQQHDIAYIKVEQEPRRFQGDGCYQRNRHQHQQSSFDGDMLPVAVTSIQGNQVWSQIAPAGMKLSAHLPNEGKDNHAGYHFQFPSVPLLVGEQAQYILSPRRLILPLSLWWHPPHLDRNIMLLILG
jgi:hypothetical protein